MGILSDLGIGGIASNIISNVMNQANNDRNYALAVRQQDFAEKSFKQQMNFNSPSTQVSLMRAAGLNPALASSGLSGSVTSASSGGLPSNNPLMPVDMSGLAALERGSVLNDVEKDKTESETRLNHIKAIHDEFENNLNQIFSYSDRASELDKKTATVRKLLNDAALSLAQGDVARSEVQLNKAREFHEYAAGGREDQEMRFISEEINWYDAKMRALIRSYDAQAYRDTQTGNLDNVNFRILNDPDVIESSRQQYHETVNKLKKENKMTDKQTEHLEELIRKAQLENDTYYWRLALDYGTSILKDIADIATLRGRISALQNIASASKQNAQTRANKADFEMNSYHTERTYDSKGRFKGMRQSRRRRNP